MLFRLPPLTDRTVFRAVGIARRRQFLFEPLESRSLLDGNAPPVELFPLRSDNWQYFAEGPTGEQAVTVGMTVFVETREFPLDGTPGDTWVDRSYDITDPRRYDTGEPWGSWNTAHAP